MTIIPGAISYSDIVAYSEKHQIMGYEYEYFEQLIIAMDHVYVDYAHKQASKGTKKGKK